MSLQDFDKLWDYQNPQETADKFQELLSEKKDSASLDYLLQLQTQIARAFGLQQKFDDAHTILDAVEKQLTADTNIAKARYLLERGRANNSSNNKEKATELFNEAVEHCNKNGLEYFEVDAAHMLGIVSSADEALKWNEKAIELAEKSSDANAKKWLGALYNNTGWTYFDKKEYSKALDIFEKTRLYYEGKKSDRHIAIAEWSKAKMYRFLNDNNTALEMLHKLENDETDPSGYTLEELAENYHVLNQTDTAQGYFAKAYELLSTDIWLQKYEAERLNRLKELGK